VDLEFWLWILPISLILEAELPVAPTAEERVAAGEGSSSDSGGRSHGGRRGKGGGSYEYNYLR
jgi:hypothetical protein